MNNPDHAKHHVRNPIQHHGSAPVNQFTMIANSIIRSALVSSDAFRVLCLFLSHVDGFEQSVVSVATTFEWGRDRARRAIRDLEQHNLLATQKFKTARGTRAYETYHLHRARPFTREEAEQFSTTVVLPAKRATAQADPCPELGQLPCPVSGQHAAANEALGADLEPTTKEDQRRRMLAVINNAIPERTPARPRLIELATIEAEAGATRGAVEDAVAQYLGRSDVRSPNLLPHLIRAEMKHDITTLLRTAIQTGEIHALRDRGYDFYPPDPPDGLDVAQIRQYMATARREWCRELLDATQQAVWM